MNIHKRRRTRRLAGLLAAGALVWLLYTAARSRVLLHNGRQIAAHSASFARDYSVGDAKAPTLNYLVMGDSTAAGWGAPTLQTTYPHLVAQSLARRGFRVRVVNVAVGGAKIGDVLRDQLGALETVRPDVVTVSVGANDATHFTAPDHWTRDLQGLVTALETSSARTIAIANTPDLFLAPALPLPLSWATARRARQQNQSFDKILKHTRLQTVDLFGQGRLDARVQPDFYAADRFHPARLGYAKWARLFARSVALNAWREKGLGCGL